MAIDGYGYWHLPILFGIVATASALRVVTPHPGRELPVAHAVELGAGVGVYLLGEVCFRRVLGLHRSRARIAAGVLACAAIPIGTQLSGVAEAGAVLAVLALTFAYEQLASP
jgi:low temperature requirement protein LtrA